MRQHANPHISRVRKSIESDPIDIAIKSGQPFDVSFSGLKLDYQDGI